MLANTLSKFERFMATFCPKIIRQKLQLRMAMKQVFKLWVYCLIFQPMSSQGEVHQNLIFVEQDEIIREDDWAVTSEDSNSRDKRNCRDANFPTLTSVIIMLGDDHLQSSPQFLTLITQFSQNYNDNESHQIPSYYLWFLSPIISLCFTLCTR